MSIRCRTVDSSLTAHARWTLLSYDSAADPDPVLCRSVVTPDEPSGQHSHRAARALYYEQTGELRQHDKEGQEDHVAALGRVLNSVILWNTRYTQRALAARRAAGGAALPEDVARLSPLGMDHRTILGRYQVLVPASVQRGAFLLPRPAPVCAP